jgi:SAM-dependent methyltransferase
MLDNARPRASVLLPENQSIMSSVPPLAVCPVCTRDLEAGILSWHQVCRACGYEASTLSPRILEQRAGGDLDEVRREKALAPLRASNFSVLCTNVRAWLGPRTQRPRLLDVGCAHGWFVEFASKDFDAIGVEPDADVAAMARARGVSLRAGFFPSVLDAEERFDVIVFNDVLEHIPDVHAVLAACRRHLERDGLLVVNAPDRRGAIYRVSKVLARAGLTSTFERMWQKDFPSPHVHYFDTQSMVGLAEANGFQSLATTTLRSVRLRGLWSRLRYANSMPLWQALPIGLCVALATPLFSLLPPDIRVWAFRPCSEEAAREGRQAKVSDTRS